MAWNYYFKDRSGAQNGPVTFEELLAVARAGRLAPDCLVWPEGGDPKPAGQVPGLAEILGGSAIFATPTGTGPLSADVPAFGLIWRGLVYAVGLALIAPAPWVGPWYYNWLASRIALPNGARLRLEASVASSWIFFVMLGLAAVSPAAIRGEGPHALAQLVGNAISFALAYFILRWALHAARSADGGLAIDFRGDFASYFGWNILIVLGVFTVVGWAWAVRGKMRWLARNIEGSHRFEFIGGAGDILWRGFAAALGAGLPAGVLFLLGAAAWAGGMNAKAALLFAAAILLLLALAGVFGAWLYNWGMSQVVVTPTALDQSERGAA